MTVGMGVMVRSFEATVQAWISASLRADLFVAPLGPGGAGSRHRIPAELADAVGADPDVAAMDRYQQVPFSFRGQLSTLATGDFAVTGSRGHLALIRGGTSPEVLGRVHRDGLADPGAVASETFARRFRLQVGDVVEIPRAGLAHRATLRGIYADYGNERGSLVLDRPVFLAWFGDARAASLALYLKPGADPAAVAARLARDRPGLQVRANGALRAQVLRIFRQTFAITYALEVIGLAVAGAGLAQALAGLALARRGDILTLRALGAGEAAVALALLGHPLPLADVVAMESIIFAIRSAAFVIPGAIGVQEGGYVLVGAALGLSPELALAVSLLKRGRELTLGLAALVVWHLVETMAKRRDRARPAAAGLEGEGQTP